MSRFNELEHTEQRLPGVETLSVLVESSGLPYTITVALPPSYQKRKRRRYPVLLVLDANIAIGGTIETCRTMSNTREVEECIVVGIGMPYGEGQEDVAWRRLWEFSPPVDNWVMVEDDFGRIFTALADTAGVSLSGAIGAADKFGRFIAEDLLPWCSENYRVQTDNVALFGHSAGGAFVLYALLGHLSGIRHFICGSPGLALSGGKLWEMLRHYRPDTAVKKQLVLGLGSAEFDNRFNTVAGITALPAFYRELMNADHPDIELSYREFAGDTHSSVMLSMLAHGLREIWGTGHDYGQEMAFFGKPWVSVLARGVKPVMHRLQRRATQEREPADLFESALLEREFEIFVSLPSSYESANNKRYPLLLVLDANFAFSSVAEQAALMARTGEIQELIVVGLGVPRHEGETAFALRRLEEFSPPIDEYDFDDELGRILTSLFALGGMDIRDHFGKAPLLLRCIIEELLPQLLTDYRVDGDDLGLAGHSAGGTFAAYALQAKDSPFRRFICGSPGLGINGSWLMREPARQAPAHDAPIDVFIGIGEEEFANAFNAAAGIPDTPNYARTLSRASTVNVVFKRFAQMSHTSVFPGIVANGLLSLWGTGAHYGDDIMTLLDRNGSGTDKDQ